MGANSLLVGVFRKIFVGFEVQVALDREAEFAAYGAKLDEADVAEFGLARPVAFPIDDRRLSVH